MRWLARENTSESSIFSLAMAVTILYIALCLIPAGNVMAQFADDVGMKRLQNEISRFERITGGKVGVGAIHLESGKEFYYNKDEAFPMASTYKVPIAVQFMTRVEKGEIALDEMITLDASDLHPGSGTISRLLNDPGVALSLHNLLELMLLISDNSATDLCIVAAGGTDAVTQRMRSIGIQNINVNRPTYILIAEWLGISSFKEGDKFSEEEYRTVLRSLSSDERAQAADRFNKDSRDTATPYAMAQLFQKIWRYEILSKENSDFLIDILRRVETGTERIKGLLPPRTPVFHKTGTIGGTTNDVGVIELPDNAGNVVTVVFIKEATGNNENSERAIAQISRSIYDYFLYTTKE